MSSSADHLYLDLSIVNNDTSGDSTIPLNFRESRTNYILDNPANYFMSVARFEVDTPGFSLPMFIPKLRMDGQNEDPNSTAYSVSIATIGAVGGVKQLTSINQQYVKWSQQDKSSLPPNNEETTTTTITTSSGTITTSVPAILAGASTSTFINQTYDFQQAGQPTTPPILVVGQNVAGENIDVIRNYNNIRGELHFYTPAAGGVPAYIELGLGARFINGTPYQTGFIESIYELSPAVTQQTGYIDGIVFSAVRQGLTYTGTIIPYSPTNQYSGIKEIVVATTSAEYPLFYTYRFYLTSNLGSVPMGNSFGTISIEINGLKQFKDPNALAVQSSSFNQATQQATISYTKSPFLPNNIYYIGPDGQLTEEISNDYVTEFDAIYQNNIATTTTAISSQDITTGYYNCYSAKWWLSCVNRALEQAWNTAAHPAPQLVIDPNTNIITLMCSYVDVTPTINFAIGEDVASRSDYLGIPTGVTSTMPDINYSIFFNESLFNLFSSFNSIYYGSNIPQATLSAGVKAVVATIPEGYKIFSNYIQPLNYDYMNTQQTTRVTGVTDNWITLKSEYSPVPMWNPIQSIVFTTSMIPIHYSMTNPPQVYGSTIYDKTYTGGGGNNGDISTMISDIQIPLTSGNEYRPTITYTPSGEYRMIDLLGNSPINEIGFAISYKTKFGQVIPFALAPQCGANLKILFRRKRYNLGNVKPYDTN